MKATKNNEKLGEGKRYDKIYSSQINVSEVSPLV